MEITNFFCMDFVTPLNFLILSIPDKKKHNSN